MRKALEGLAAKFPSRVCALELFNFLVAKGIREKVWEEFKLSEPSFKKYANELHPKLFEKLMKHYLGTNPDLFTILSFITEELRRERRLTDIIDVRKSYENFIELLWELIKLDPKVKVNSKKELMENEELLKAVCGVYKIKLPVTAEEKVKLRKRVFYLNNKQNGNLLEEILLEEE